MVSDPEKEARPQVHAEFPKGFMEKLELCGFKYRWHDESAVMFVAERGLDDRRFGSAAYAMPWSAVPVLDQQLSLPVVQLPDHFGFVCAERGYFEVIIANIRSIRSRLFEPFMRGDGDDPEVTGCRHAGDRKMPSVELEPERPGTLRMEKVHVTDLSAGVCVEVSRASPAGVLFSPPNARAYNPNGRRLLSTMSLKVDLGVPHDSEQLIAKGIAISNSLLFEINVRNGLPVEPVRRAEYEREPVRARAERVNSWRFPQTTIQHEVAELFFFAESARDNPPLAFLSFYQVLEYFFPSAVRRNAIKRVRKEIADPNFVSSSDSAIVRILAAAESVASSSEATQIATLITDSVRDDKLLEFFEHVSDKKYFTKGGPISGVDHINVKNTQRSLKIQVADRVYQIRNRIVHAKDDPKYQDVRVLLPKSREAYALSLDISLVRLLATEVIIDSQAF